MNTRIRAAKPDDVEVILELIRQLAEFENLSSEVKATEHELKKTIFDEGHAKVFLAEVDEDSAWKCAGFALYFTSYSTFLGKPGLYLEDLYVIPEYRSNGIGNQLLAQLAKICVSLNYGRLEWSVLDWNKRALEFYLRLGAKPMQEWTVHRLTGKDLDILARNAGNRST